VNAYKERFGFYPEVVHADGIYGTRDNRKWLKEHGIRFAGKPLGRPRKVTDENRAEMNQTDIPHLFTSDFPFKKTPEIYALKYF